MFILCAYSYSELTYNRSYHYPRWAIILGWMMACSSVIMIPLTAIVKLALETGTFKQVSTILLLLSFPFSRGEAIRSSLRCKTTFIILPLLSVGLFSTFSPGFKRPRQGIPVFGQNQICLLTAKQFVVTFLNSVTNFSARSLGHVLVVDRGQLVFRSILKCVHRCVSQTSMFVAAEIAQVDPSQTESAPDETQRRPQGPD